MNLRLAATIAAKPWDMEPKTAQFVYLGYSCNLKRGPLRAWCGYVTVPETHPLYGKAYTDSDFPMLMVHGGVTYSNSGTFGFDCAHMDDLIPDCVLKDIARGNTDFSIYEDDVYRTYEYAFNETMKLARELKRYERNG